MLINVAKREVKPETKKTTFAKGATTKFSGNIFTAEIDTSKVPRSIVEKIEQILLAYSSETNKEIERKVDSDLNSVEYVIKSMKNVANEAGVYISESNIKGHIPVATRILEGSDSEKEKMERLKENIKNHFGKR